jgi:hypothetical protein
MAPILEGYPHLDPRIAQRIADSERRIAAMPKDEHGRPVIPASADQWIRDNVSAHTHFESEEG